MADLCLKRGWKFVNFGDVVRQVKDVVAPSVSGLDRFIAGEHMVTDDLHIRQWGVIGDGYLGPAFHMRFKSGQVLYGSRRTYLRKVALAEFDGICANTTYVLETVDPKILLPKLLPFIMQTEKFHEHSIKQSKGSVNPYINFSDLAWYQFSIPPIDEQMRIANLLWDADNVVKEWKDAVNIAETLFASLRENLLCNNRLPRKRLSTCVNAIVAGKSVLGINSSAEDGSFGVLKVSAIGYNNFIPTENKLLVDKNDFIPEFNIKANDLLITRANTRELVGRACLVPSDYPNLMLCDKTLRLQVDESKANKIYLNQVLHSSEVRAQIEAVASGTGSAMKNITQTQILNFVIPLPSMGYQEELAQEILQIEKKLEGIYRRLKNAHNIKSYLLNSILLTEN